MVVGGCVTRAALPVAVIGALAGAVFGAAAIVVRSPGAAQLVTAAAAVAGVTVIADGKSSSIVWFALCLLGGWLAFVATLPVMVGYLIGTLAVLVVETVVTPDPGWAAWIAGTALSVVGFWAARRQRVLVDELRAAQAGLAERAQAEERNRIARELHDVIAHSLTVSLLHVSSARLAVRDAPEEAEKALADAERLGRASLDEVRHAVGLLRRADAPDPRTPLPGSTDVPALIERYRSAGADVDLTLDGSLDAVPATVGLAAHRIVQESLTNAAKHAAGAPTRVLVSVDPHTLCLEIDSAGTPGTGSGHGLVGMRERAEAVGGTLSAGPGGRGWLVRAALPVGTPA